MIYDPPAPTDPLDQGDVIDACPVLSMMRFDRANPTQPETKCTLRRVVVLTQTCDVANDKAVAANVAEVFDAQALIDQKLFKPADVKGPLRGGRIWGWYFLPADATLGLGEMVVDLRRLHTIRLDLLRELCAAGAARPACGRYTVSTWRSTSRTRSAASDCRGRMRLYETAAGGCGRQSRCAGQQPGRDQHPGHSTR